MRIFRHRTDWSAGFLLPLLCASCADRVPEWCAAPVGVELRIANEPAGWSSSPAFKRVWRLDGSVAGHELVAPAAVAMGGPDGRIAVADVRLREVAVIGADGSWLGRWGSSGAGPGELTAPFAAAWRSDGKLIVYDPARSKLVVFDTTGSTLDDEPVDPAFTAALGGGARSIDMTGSGVLLAQPAPPFVGEDALRPHVLIRGGPVGAGVDTLAQRAVPVVTAQGAAPITAPGHAVPVGAMSGDTLLAIAGDTPWYRITVYRNGAHALTICRNVDPIPLADEESDPFEPDVPDQVVEAMRRAQLPDVPARIGGLVIDRVGRLWVQRDRPRPLSGLDGLYGRPGALYDVYDADGVWLGEVRMPDGVRFVNATDDLVIGLATDELDVLSVVALRPDW